MQLSGYVRAVVALSEYVRFYVVKQILYVASERAISIARSIIRVLGIHGVQDDFALTHFANSNSKKFFRTRLHCSWSDDFLYSGSYASYSKTCLAVEFHEPSFGRKQPQDMGHRSCTIKCDTNYITRFKYALGTSSRWRMARIMTAKKGILTSNWPGLSILSEDATQCESEKP